MAMYFMISPSEDGAYITAHTYQEILEMLNDPDGPNVDYFPEFNKHSESNPMYWGEGGCLLIKGEIVVPKPVEVTTKFEIE